MPRATTPLGEAIRAARLARRWSQADLARALNVQRQSVSLWEAGGAISPLSRTALHDLFGPELGPREAPSVASLAYWQGRAAWVEQLAAELLEAQRAIVEEMGRQIPPLDDRPEVAAVERAERALDATPPVAPPIPATAPKSRRKKAG